MFTLSVYSAFYPTETAPLHHSLRCRILQLHACILQPLQCRNTLRQLRRCCEPGIDDSRHLACSCHMRAALPEHFSVRQTKPSVTRSTTRKQRRNLRRFSSQTRGTVALLGSRLGNQTCCAQDGIWWAAEGGCAVEEVAVAGRERRGARSSDPRAHRGGQRHQYEGRLGHPQPHGLQAGARACRHPLGTCLLPHHPQNVGDVRPRFCTHIYHTYITHISRFS